jgi:hypothetical protein
LSTIELCTWTNNNEKDATISVLDIIREGSNRVSNKFDQRDDTTNFIET